MITDTQLDEWEKEGEENDTISGLEGEIIIKLVGEVRELRKDKYESMPGFVMDQAIEQHGELISLLRRNDEILDRMKNEYDPNMIKNAQLDHDWNELKYHNAKWLKESGDD